MQAGVQHVKARWIGDPSERERIHLRNADATERLLGTALAKGRWRATGSGSPCAALGPRPAGSR